MSQNKNLEDDEFLSVDAVVDDEMNKSKIEAHVIIENAINNDNLNNNSLPTMAFNEIILLNFSMKYFG